MERIMWIYDKKCWLIHLESEDEGKKEERAQPGSTQDAPASKSVTPNFCDTVVKFRREIR